jgi:hypothetical protein
MHAFPVVGWHHLDCIPGTTIEKRTIRTFACTLLTADTEVRIDFDSSKRRVVLIRHPEHARFDRTVLDTRGRTGATGAAVGGNREDARPLFSGGFAVALRHGPVLVYDVVHWSDSNIALRNSSTICVDAVLGLLRNVSSYKERS